LCYQIGNLEQNRRVRIIGEEEPGFEKAAHEAA
jgi:hypothetical protein